MQKRFADWHLGDQVEVWTDDQWVQGFPLVEARFGHRAIQLEDGRILVVGGVGAGVNVHQLRYLKTAELIDSGW